MWPGNIVKFDGYLPTYMDDYDKKVTPYQKVDKILNWLDLPTGKRPSFIAVYMSNVDVDGHEFGTESANLDKTIIEADETVGQIFEGLKKRNLTEIVNLIIVTCKLI